MEVVNRKNGSVTTQAFEGRLDLSRSKALAACALEPPIAKLFEIADLSSVLLLSTRGEAEAEMAR